MSELKPMERSAADVAHVHRQRLWLPALGGLYDDGEPKAYAIMRFSYGMVLLTHGLPKLFGFPHGDLKQPFEATVDMIGNMMHWPAPLFFGYLVTALETIGVIALALGFLTRLVAAMLLFEMATIAIAVYPVWVWSMHGMEYPFILGLIAFYIMIRGGGRYSVDHGLGREF